MPHDVTFNPQVRNRPAEKESVNAQNATNSVSVDQGTESVAITQKQPAAISDKASQLSKSAKHFSADQIASRDIAESPMLAVDAQPTRGQIASPGVRATQSVPAPQAAQAVPAARPQVTAGSSPRAMQAMPAVRPQVSIEPGTPAQTSGYHPANIEAPASRQAKPAPRFDAMDVMSSRSHNQAKAFAESDAEIADARSESRGLATAPVISEMAQDYIDKSNAKKAEVTNPIKNGIDAQKSNSVAAPLAEKSRMPVFKDLSNKRPAVLAKAEMNMLEERFKNPGVGYRVWGKINGLPELDLRDVGVGVDEIAAVIAQNGAMFDKIVEVATGTENISSWKLSDVVAYINSNNVYVGTGKPPCNERSDAQSRRLRILTRQRRGIYLHPYMASMYNADMDGDDMEVSFDPKFARMTSDPMANMVKVNGSIGLNVDFLPVSRFVDGYAPGKTSRDYIREVIFGRFTRLGNEHQINKLVDAVLGLSETELKGKDEQTSAWIRVFRAARATADLYASSNRRASESNRRHISDQLMSDLCRAVFDNMQRIKVENVFRTEAVLIDADDVPSPRAYDDMALYACARDMVSGEVPRNFQDLKVMLNGFIGNIEGKNAAFRFTADIGKTMKLDPRLQIGDGSFLVDSSDEFQMSLLFDSMVKYAASQRMATEVKKTGRSQSLSDRMRKSIIEEIGFFEDHESSLEFLESFVRAYNKHSAIINESNLVYLSTMAIQHDSNRSIVSPLNPSHGGVTLGDIAEPYAAIYGSYSLGRLFNALKPSMTGVDTLWSGNPNRPQGSANRPVKREYDYRGTSRFWISRKYREYSLRQFQMENRMIRQNSGLDDEGGKPGIRNTKLSSLAGRSNEDIQFDLLLAIADKGTSRKSTFAKKVYGTKGDRDSTVELMSTLLYDLDRQIANGDVKWVDSAVDALIESGPEMFQHFKMDSPQNFLQSDYAKKMIEHRDDTNILGGIRTAMVFNYRMAHINTLKDSLPNPIDNVYRFMDSYGNLEFAIDELSSSSEAWRGIIKELEAEDTPWSESFFHMMINGANPVKTRIDGKKYSWKVEYAAKDFWMNPEGHTSLMSVINDLDLSREVKWNVITDIVRYWENDANLNSYEIGYMLEVGKDSSYSLMLSDVKSALGVYTDFRQAFNRWSQRNEENLRKNINDAYERWGRVPGALMHTLKYLDSAPWELVDISASSYADGIVSTSDKVHAQTEKAKQHPWSNSIYSAESFQRNGGFMNDITRTDDRLLGIQHSGTIGIQEIIHIFANPDASIIAYDDNGAYTSINSTQLLREAIGHEPTGSEEEIWTFFRNNPRIATAIRKHRACTIADTDGTGYLGAALSTTETISSCIGPSGNHIAPDPKGHVRYLLRNKPVYAGIIALATGTYGTVGRNQRERYAELEDYFSGQIYRFASITDMDSSVASQAILEDIGITRNAVREAIRSDFDRFCEEAGLPVIDDSNKAYGDERSESDNRADFAYDVAVSNLAGYIDEVRKKVPLGQQTATRRTNFSDIRSGKTISGFIGENRFLSNFYPSNIVLDGISYKNAEAAFQAQKCANPADKQRFSKLSGREARALGRKIDIRNDWESVKEYEMRRVIRAKFSNPDLRKKLEETGDAILIETNTWNDRTWGVSNGEGHNLLGKILMDTRYAKGKYDRKPSGLGPDVSSAAAFWDVIQELSGSKTNVSTGVEGRETYDFAEWATHMSTKDRYADLDAVIDSVDYSWNGMWTSAIDANGNAIPLVVDENGVIANYDDIRDAVENADMDEIVVGVPEGYTVPDRSTDTHGIQVQSAMVYMVSKRADGAEKNNLKTRKAGFDGSDSITKMEGKRKQVEDDSGNMKDVNFFEIREKLRDIARRNGINYAKLELSKMMFEENQDLGYDDLSLSDYMCIADLMLIEDPNSGNVYLRTLEMLFTAMKNRIGPAIDQMSEDEIREAVDAIVNDTSDTGVGIAIADPFDIVDEFRPAAKAGSANGIRPASSVFERNYDLLEKIAEDAENIGIFPMSQARASSLDRKIRGDERSDGISGISSVLNRAYVARNYSAVGYAGAFSDENSAQPTTDIKWTIGASNAIVIGDGYISDAEMLEICEKAYGLGMTLIVSQRHLKSIPWDFAKDAMPCSDYGDALIPCFDMRLNGAESLPYSGGRFAVFKDSESRIVTTVEDGINYFQLSDAQYIATDAFVNRIHVVDNRSLSISARNLFPNVYRNPNFDHHSTSVSFANIDEIEQLIVRGVRCSIDYGIVEGANGFDQRKHDVDQAIERYRQRWSEANPDGFMLGVECQPGDIIGWMQIEIADDYDPGNVQYAFSPIIPFQLSDSTKNIAEKFVVNQVAYVNKDNTLLSVDWTNTTSVLDGEGKYFDSSSRANKGMINFTSRVPGQPTLLSGTPIDLFVFKESTSSRNIGTDKRIKTMVALMFEARICGYNFAKVDGAFPENDDLRKRLISGEVPKSEWRSYLADGKTMLFIDDPEINGFLNHECRKFLRNGGNPSDYLANVFTSENGVDEKSYVWWEFEGMFEPGLTYEHYLLRFLHLVVKPDSRYSNVVKAFCPDGVEDLGDDCLFRLYRDRNGMADGYDRGVLQMLVPYDIAGTVRLWSIVYKGWSFFSDDYSGFSRANINGASNFLDAANALSYHGKELDKKQARIRALWATSDLSKLPHDGGALGKPERRMEE